MPYAQLTTQINLWTLPISIGFKTGWLLGFKELYKQFVSDANIESFGFRIGGNIKALIWRNDYFFLDMKADFNYDKGSLSIDLYKNLYIPIKLGYLGGTDTGVIFEATPGFKTYWRAFLISPKLTFGFKIKNKVPVIKYFGVSLSVGYDSSFVSSFGRTYISTSKAYANMKDFTKTVNGLKFTDIEEYGSSYFGDIRLSISIDIFYMSFLAEYGVFSKMWSILFAPLVFRF